MSTRSSGFLRARASGLCGLLCALLGGSVGAVELPKSPACRTALEALDQAEEAIAASAAASSASLSDHERQRPVAARLQPLRKRVADACLGGLTTSPPPSQHTWTAPAPPARSTAATPRVRIPETPQVTVPMPRFEAPVTVSNCNAATCLASDGSTLVRVGPNLVGPRGACTVQGVFVRCP